ncbi:MAG: helix-turn-helix transcriptional regulator [Planctomycetes bacterium]|nr:helix-turn-helix transcriptional regulator [Planctomycetota bacterium]
MTNDDKALRERLKRLVAERSQSDVARKTGAQVAAVNRYVHGARIPGAFCAALVRGLDVNPAWLLMGEGSPYLGDVPERTARLGENLLELVEAMSAVSHMLLGSLAGKHHLKILRELNDALRVHEHLREKLNERSRPVFQRILGDLQKTLDKLDLDRAADLRKAADQLSRLCDDEALTREYLRMSAYHDFQLKASDSFLATQRRLFLRTLPDNSLFDESACVEARRIVVALTQQNRVPEALRICRATRALAGREGRKWQAWAQLENTYGVLLAETGQLRRAIAVIQRGMPRLSGMFRKISEAALNRMLMWAGVLSIDDAIAIGEATDAKARHLAHFAAWQLDTRALKKALAFAEAPGVEPVWGRSLQVIYARHLYAQLREPSRDRADEYEREMRQAFDDSTGMFDVIVYICRCELNRLAGRKKQAMIELRKAEKERRALLPDMLPDPLDLGVHFRSALALLKPGDPLARRARRWFKRYVSRGYLCFEGVLQMPR